MHFVYWMGATKQFADTLSKILMKRNYTKYNPDRYVMYLE